MTIYLIEKSGSAFIGVVNINLLIGGRNYYKSQMKEEKLKLIGVYHGVSKR